jgi:hypothetical protein
MIVSSFSKTKEIELLEILWLISCSLLCMNDDQNDYRPAFFSLDISLSLAST